MPSIPVSLAGRALLFTSTVLAATAAAGETARTPSAVDYALFPRAAVGDAAECALTASTGAGGPIVDFGPAVTNPAMTCPDSFAWHLFAKAVGERFWSRYGTDATMFPREPWPACPGGSGQGCCAALGSFVPGQGPAATEGAAAATVDHRPAYPGLAGSAAPAPVHEAFPPSKAHRLAAAGAAGDGTISWQEVPPIERTMVIANRTVEVVYRNRPMFDYVLAHELYHRAGLARVFARFAANRRINAPWRVDQRSAAADAAGVLPIARIAFPVGSVMLKANWLPVSAAQAVGIDIARDGPFVTVRLDPTATQADAAPQRHILLSLHISSKDTPNWVWATFEHVANQGRCDLIGCNDSFGYRAPAPEDFDGTVAGAAFEAARNFIPADQVTDDLGAGVDILAFAGRYPAGERTAALQSLFDAYGIAGAAASPGEGEGATVADPAWGMYRLKGSLVDFVSPTGVARIVGNSITEAGFSESSSCMSCHANAAVNDSGEMAFAIFRRTISYLGFPESVSGAPDPALFAVQTGSVHTTGVSEQLAVPTDFVWGFRFANSLAPPPARQ